MSPRTRIVVLLGAGFSKAVSEEMPLMGELGDAIGRRFRENSELERLLSPSQASAIAGGRIPLGNVEVWLSSLAADQPFLSTSENLRRHALFSELAAQIAEEVEDSRAASCEAPMPDWLIRFLTALHFLRGEVLTLNYDILVEVCVNSLQLLTDKSERTRAGHLMQSLPPEVPEMGRFAEETRESFALRKLHGSTDWFGRASNTDLYSVVRADALVPAWGDPPGVLRQAPAALLSGIEPMILPPISDKSILYGNPTMAGVWRRARTALAAADELMVFGYSMPQTDSSVLALLADSVNPRTQVSIVDRNPDKVAANLKALELADPTLISPTDTAAFADMLRRLEASARRSVDFEPLRLVNPNSFVEARLPNGERWPIVADRRAQTGEVELMADAEERHPRGATINPSGVAIDLPSLIADVQSIRFQDGRIAVPLGAEVLKDMSEESCVSLHVSHPA